MLWIKKFKKVIRCVRSLPLAKLSANFTVLAFEDNLARFKSSTHSFRESKRWSNTYVVTVSSEESHIIEEDVVADDEIHRFSYI